MNKIKSCVFVSGNGSNLRSILKCSRDNCFPIKINLILTDNLNSPALNLGKKYSINCVYFSSKDQKRFERKSLLERIGYIHNSMY